MTTKQDLACAALMVEAGLWKQVAAKPGMTGTRYQCDTDCKYYIITNTVLPPGSRDVDFSPSTDVAQALDMADALGMTDNDEQINDLLDAMRSRMSYRIDKPLSTDLAAAITNAVLAAGGA